MVLMQRSKDLRAIISTVQQQLGATRTCCSNITPGADPRGEI